MELYLVLNAQRPLSPPRDHAAHFTDEENGVQSAEGASRWTPSLGSPTLPAGLPVSLLLCSWPIVL